MRVNMRRMTRAVYADAEEIEADAERNEFEKREEHRERKRERDKRKTLIKRRIIVAEAKGFRDNSHSRARNL